MKKVLDYLQTKLNDEDTVILACSAGPDSMCLFSLLEKLSINIICAHVNHNIRAESIEEQKFLEDYCQKRNIIFEFLNLKNISKSNFEAEARKKRYKFFNELAKKYNAKYILTAHHGDDLIETILMRITRGSNLSGYVGIKKEEGIYLRPLLDVSKEEIEKYLHNNNIKSFHDHTNDEDDHTRNRYRHYVVPVLKKEYANIHQKYLMFSTELQEYDNFFNSYIKELDIINNNRIDLNLFFKQDKFIERKVIELLIKNIQKKSEFEVSKKTVEDIYNLAFSKRSNVKIDLKNNYIAKKSYNILSVEKKSASKPYNKKFSRKFQNDMFIIKNVKQSQDDSNYVIRLDSKELKMPLIIRSRKPKDVIELKDLGHKKIKDIFIDCKIDLDQRDIWPLVVDSNNNIVWIPGIKKSKFAKDKKEKYDIILSSERKQLDE